MKNSQAVAYMAQAFINARLSKAERRKAGAVLVNEDSNGMTRIISEGYNGTRPGECNKCEDAEGNTLSYGIVIHAERNALDKAGDLKSIEGKNSLFITRFPCPECSDLIINSNISKVYYCEVSLSDTKTKHGDLDPEITIRIPKDEVIHLVSEVVLGLTKPKFN